MKIDIDQSDFGTLCICAIRYCHGRRTYMPSQVQEIIGKHFDDLSDRDIEDMNNDCRFMTIMDYGDEMIDKPKWLRWESKLRKEHEKRERAVKPNDER